MEEGLQKYKRLSYTAKLKHEVIRCAEEKGNRKASAIFGVDKSNVQLWWKHNAAISRCEASRRKFTAPKKGRFPEIDDAIFTFFQEMQDWTVCELRSTWRGGDKEGQILEHSSKSF
jgi:hypothetical protein